MSEYRKSSEQLLLDLLRYIKALERGDIEALSAVLDQASHDLALGALLEEVDAVYRGIDGTTLSDVEARQAVQRVLAPGQWNQQPVLIQDLTTQQRKRKQESFMEEQPTLTIPQIHNYQLQNHHQPLREKPRQPPQRPRKWRRGLQLLVAFLAIGALVGSMVFVLHAVYPDAPTGMSNSGNATPSVAPSPTPSIQPTSTAFVQSTTSGNWGKVIYYRKIQELNGNSVQAVAWSPDSQRIAVLTSNNVQIWDATTGGHPLTILSPYSSPTDVSTLLSWSPDGKWLAVDDQSGVWLANAQIGKIVHRFPMGMLLGTSTDSLLLPGRSSSISLSALQVNSGGLQTQISGLVWSPDSSLLAVSTDKFEPDPSNDRFEILNVQAGTVVHVFSGLSAARVAVVGWSSDGKYIAAKTEDNSFRWTAWVWNASTYIVVLQQSMGSGDSGGTMTWAPQLSWQPHTDNLAFAQIARQSSSNIAGVFPNIVLWDAVHNKRLKQYTVANNLGFFTISPDGTYLAVLNLTGQLVVLNIQSGQQVYVYNPQIKDFHAPGDPKTLVYHTMDINSLAWSPNGKYMVFSSGYSADPALVLGAE